jgi:pyridoxamine 5'-phosphate oxidase
MTDPLYQEARETLGSLLAEAAAAGDAEPAAMTLATVGADGRPHARVVLLKGIDERGLRIFTNYDSAKAADLAVHPVAAVCLHWKTLRDGVQVRVEGAIERLPAAESDAYFATRARGSRIGAWASPQSQPLAGRAEFEARIADVEQRFAGRDVPRPPNWGGYLLTPSRFEFWYGARFRLHQRTCYVAGAGRWSRGQLYP